MKLRATLERHLKESGITASALAAKAGVPKATLLGWLAGKAPRDLNQLRSVARFIGTSIDALVFDDDQANLPASFSGFYRDEEGWHTGLVELRFRHLDAKTKKNR
jgi:transcriptional regulator with XRE-family HTH domain